MSTATPPTYPTLEVFTAMRIRQRCQVFLDWVKTQNPERTYAPASASKCALAQFRHQLFGKGGDNPDPFLMSAGAGRWLDSSSGDWLVVVPEMAIPSGFVAMGSESCPFRSFGALATVLEVYLARPEEIAAQR